MKQAEILATKFQLAGVDVSAERIADLIQTQANEFSITEEMAAPLIESELIATHDLDLNTYKSAAATELSYEYVGDLDTPEEFVQLVAVVDELWDTYDNRIQQMGTVSDETGRIKFTAWDAADQPPLKQGAVYHFWNVVVKEYNGELELKLTSKSEIEQLADDDSAISGHLTPKQDAVPFEGVITRVEPGSGLIKRCSADDCTHVLKNGHCSKHGNVNGEDDLRVMAMVDDGSEHRQITMTTETVETLLGFSVRDATTHPDIDVDESIHNTFVGQYADCSLVEYEDNNYVSSIELNPTHEAEYIEDLRSLANELKYTL